MPLQPFKHKISVPNLKVYAYHGCLPEEARIGSNYEVCVNVETNFSLAAQNDDINHTVDYVVVAAVVKKEMAIRSKLLEQVAQRIVNTLKGKYPSITMLAVAVRKMNPPINADVPYVEVAIEEVY